MLTSITILKKITIMSMGTILYKNILTLGDWISSLNNLQSHEKKIKRKKLKSSYLKVYIIMLLSVQGQKLQENRNLQGGNVPFTQ